MFHEGRSGCYPAAHIAKIINQYNTKKEQEN